MQRTELPTGRQPAHAPPRHLLLAEQQAIAEYGAFLAAVPLLVQGRRGDGHPILLLPPFTSDDASTHPLKLVLRARGLAAHGWGLGRNLWRTPEIMEGLPRRLEHLHGVHGRGVSLVGWSAGGMFARELARDFPDLVRQVITLGSPFRRRAGDRSNAGRLAPTRADSPRHVPTPPELQRHEHERPPLPVPVSAIYTRTDGIVAWHLCIEAEGALRENIEVRGTHSGLGFNPATVLAVVDRLTQAEGTWEPFRPPPERRLWYPRPAVWRSTNDLAVP